ncbi:hypothetical protein CYCD_21520 [Tenuifilaceae bacterium CYCD]|nr:hypothetical protein CYCD_21520 [Tenuifilaceae bacterium CYCD]
MNKKFFFIALGGISITIIVSFLYSCSKDTKSDETIIKPSQPSLSYSYNDTLNQFSGNNHNTNFVWVQKSKKQKR